MRTAHARMSIDGICVQVRGNVVREFLLRETQFGGLRRKEKRISAFLAVRNAVALNKSGFAPLQILLGEDCRSHSLAELRWKGHWCSCTLFLLRRPF